MPYSTGRSPRSMIPVLLSVLVFVASLGPLFSQSFDELSMQAEAARSRGDLAGAVDAYRIALKSKPDWQEGWWYLGTILYDQYRYEEARDAFRKLAALAPRNGPALALLGLCGYQLRDYERALVDLQKARLLGVGDNSQLSSVLRYHAAILLTRMEQYEAAYEVLEGFAREGVGTANVIEAFGLMTLRMPYLPIEVPPHRREIILMAGRATFEVASLHFEKADELYRELIARYPREPNAHYAYGTFLMRDRREAGLESFRKALELDPRLTAALLQIAFEYIDRGSFEEALPFAERAVASAANSFEAHNALGRALLETGSVEEAIRELERAVELDALNPETRFTLSRAYLRAGRTEDAARERVEFQRLSEAKEEIRSRLEAGGTGQEGPAPR